MVRCQFGRRRKRRKFGAVRSPASVSPQGDVRPASTSGVEECQRHLSRSGRRFYTAAFEGDATWAPEYRHLDNTYGASRPLREWTWLTPWMAVRSPEGWVRSFPKTNGSVIGDNMGAEKGTGYFSALMNLSNPERYGDIPATVTRCASSPGPPPRKRLPRDRQGYRVQHLLLFRAC